MMFTVCFSNSFNHIILTLMTLKHLESVNVKITHSDEL